MAQSDNTKASASAVKQAQNNWSSFIKVMSVCGGLIAITLILMAIFVA